MVVVGLLGRCRQVVGVALTGVLPWTAFSTQDRLVPLWPVASPVCRFGPMVPLLTPLQMFRKSLNPETSVSVAPLLTLGMLGTPLDVLFTRSPMLTSRGGLTLHPLWTVVGLTGMALPPAVSKIAAVLLISRKSLWLLAVSSAALFVVLYVVVSALRTLLVL